MQKKVQRRKKAYFGFIIRDVTIDDRASSGALYATQEKILRSRALARRVVEKLELWKLPFFRSSIDPSDTEARNRLVKTAVRKLPRRR